MFSGATLYLGKVSHQRYRPKRHGFCYPYFMFWLPLDNLAQTQESHPWLFRRFAPIKFHRQNYLGDKATPLADSIRARANLVAGHENQVFMLSQLQYFGCYFSPVNFYFIGDGKQMHTLVAEVSNTPWGERHHYVISLSNNFEHPKSFQVSPFMAKDQIYSWRVDVNHRQIQITISSKEEQKMFDASLALTPHPLTKGAAFKAVLVSPWLIFSTRVRIYLQAAKLWLKGTPFLGHQGDHGNDNFNKEQ